MAERIAAELAEAAALHREASEKFARDLED
jgi:hypothetical protein